MQTLMNDARHKIKRAMLDIKNAYSFRLGRMTLLRRYPPA